MSRSDKEFSRYKQKEYDQLYRSKLDFLTHASINELRVRSVAESLQQFLGVMSDSQILQLKVVPAAAIAHALEQITVRVEIALTNRFSRVLSGAWLDLFRLGRYHQTLDFLHSTQLWSGCFSTPLKFSSLQGGSIADFVNAPDSIGSFSAESDKLERDLRELKESGAFDGIVSTRLAARLSLEEKLRFMQMIEDVSDYQMKSKALEPNFINSEYLRQRVRVLSADYSKRQSEAIKSTIADYLKQDTETPTQLRAVLGGGGRSIEVIRNILDQPTIRGADRARTILRTELNLAYNFGKLSGFSAPADRKRKMRVNADWELEQVSPGYEVCEFCKEMDGKELSVETLLYWGTRLDRSVLKYRGSKNTQTSFKASKTSPPPFHPNCGCYLTLVEEDDEEEEEEEEASRERQPAEPNKELMENIQTAATVAAGAALIVGGLFLLSRSNIFSGFLRSANSSAFPAASNRTIIEKTSTVIQSLGSSDDLVYQQMINNLSNTLN
ncbi:hypothetical protein [Chroococcidiopsis sp.]|uniref:hypothetical protein n=1 Tax=Chroococcidiopsis sp. TaxID=3088168 RepID=UPI003F34614A